MHDIRSEADINAIRALKHVLLVTRLRPYPGLILCKRDYIAICGGKDVQDKYPTLWATQCPAQ